MARLLCILLFGVQGGFCLYEFFQAGSWLYLIPALWAFLNGLGLFRMWSWSKYSVYLFSFVAGIEWFFLSWQTRGSWAHLRFTDLFFTFLPGMIILSLYLYVSLVAHNLFNKRVN